MFSSFNKLSIKAYSGCNLNCVYCHQLPTDKYHPSIFNDVDNLEKFLLSIPFDDVVDVTITGGEITLKNLADQIALNTGFGVRYDLEFLVLRFDVGVALHYPYDTGKSGYYNIPSFAKGYAWHFAIGYPF